MRNDDSNDHRDCECFTHPLRSGLASGQTILFDFETGRQGWGSYGAITTDSGELPFDGSVGQGRFHTADFSITDTGNFGIVDISPVGQDLSAFGGLSVDARFLDVPTFPPFVGVKELDIVVAKGADATEEEFFAPKATMTDQYQTFSVMFNQFASALTGLPPSTADLASMQIKLVVLNINGTGVAEFQYDQITGLPPVAGDNADFDSDGDVDGKDFLIWQRGYGSGTTRAQGDANGSGTVTGADLTVWQGQYGGTGGLAAIAVPEPTNIALLTLALLGCGPRVMRRRV